MQVRRGRAMVASMAFLLCLPGLPYPVPYQVRADFGGLVVEIEIFVVIL
jgi:hypothetical protein